MRYKKACEKAVRTTISMPPELWKIAMSDQKKRSLPTFSDYIQELIRSKAAQVAMAHGAPVAITHGAPVAGFHG